MVAGKVIALTVAHSTKSSWLVCLQLPGNCRSQFDSVPSLDTAVRKMTSGRFMEMLRVKYGSLKPVVLTDSVMKEAHGKTRNMAHDLWVDENMNSY